MRKYITVTQEIRDALVRKYKVSKTSIWKALAFITRNKRSDQIRNDALSMGGRYVEEDFIPNCRTEYKSGVIIQTFAGDVNVITTSGFMEILVEGEVVASFEDVTIATWGNVMAGAQEISQKRVFNN